MVSKENGENEVEASHVDAASNFKVPGHSI